MKTGLSWIAILAAFAVGIALVSCSPEKGGGSPKTEAKTNESAARSGGPASTFPSLDELPAELKNAAYEYLGLANPEPVKYSIENSADPSSATTDTQKVTLVDIRDGEAVFVVEWSGRLAELGAQEMVLRPDGAFTTKVGTNTLEPPQMMIPAPASPGKSWKTSADLSFQGGRSISEHSTYRVVKTEKVVVGGKTYDALRIESTGKSVVNGVPYDSKAVLWYVKGRGLLKMETTLKGKDETQTVRLEQVE